jgi:hypothetical protein
MRLSHTFLMFSLGLLALSTKIQARDKKVKTPPKDTQDEIEVVGHISSTGGTVSHFVATQHYSSYYLYAEHEGGKIVTLIDVTNTEHPAVLADVAYPPSGGATNLSTVAGTAALVSSASATQTQPPPQTIKLLDFSDPQHPKVTREFTGITAMDHDDRRGLIFLANADGIWILRQKFAEDPEVKRAYDYYVIYGSSMYPPPK